jgi:hypothetical protein
MQTSKVLLFVFILSLFSFHDSFQQEIVAPTVASIVVSTKAQNVVTSMTEKTTPSLVDETTTSTVAEIETTSQSSSVSGNILSTITISPSVDNEATTSKTEMENPSSTTAIFFVDEDSGNESSVSLEEETTESEGPATQPPSRPPMQCPDVVFPSGPVCDVIVNAKAVKSKATIGLIFLGIIVIGTLVGFAGAFILVKPEIASTPRYPPYTKEAHELEKQNQYQFEIQQEQEEDNISDNSPRSF